LNVVDLLKQDAFQLPHRPVDNYVDYLGELLGKYANALGQASSIPGLPGFDPTNAKTLVKSVAKHLLATLKASVGGRPGDAATRFSNALDLLETDIQTGISEDLTRGDFGPVYRFRVDPPSYAFARPDLFHIPFDKRHKVAAQRYSFPGVPCLYFGETTFVCWEEMKRPPFSNVWMSAFKLVQDQTLRLLNFAYRPRMAASHISDRGPGLENAPKAQKWFASYLRTWPLLAACSFQARHPGSPFIIEYVLPQLLLRWILDNKDVDGIRYFSTHLTHEAIGLGATNYVVPSRTAATSKPAASQQCPQLRSLFEMTLPQNWELLARLSTLSGRTQECDFGIPMGPDDTPVRYDYSDFYAQEKRLEQLTFKAI
jgi:hypothetical protein